MTKILKTVLAKRLDIAQATSSYIDDIYVNTSSLDVKVVLGHLSVYGLTCKEPEQLDGGTILGLKLRIDNSNQLWFGRGKDLPVVPENLSKRELHSICGKLVGHYPIAGWLRTTCSMVKRMVSDSGWDVFVGEPTRRVLLNILETVKRDLSLIHI